MAILLRDTDEHGQIRGARLRRAMRDGERRWPSRLGQAIDLQASVEPTGYKAFGYSYELCNIIHNTTTGAMAKVETNTRKIVERLKRCGWVNVGRANHDRFTHPARPGHMVVVPRHRAIKPGTARSIARQAGWI
jgi:predicted RNA binding protein YcfA (HicA-like mRNA interferase family)